VNFKSHILSIHKIWFGSFSSKHLFQLADVFKLAKRSQPHAFSSETDDLFIKEKYFMRIDKTIKPILRHL
jgi:hypothetical protein